MSCDYADLRGQQFDLVINSTSASLKGQLPALPPGIFAEGALAYDMMYGTGHTPFLQFAQEQGLTPERFPVEKLFVPEAAALPGW